MQRLISLESHVISKNQLDHQLLKQSVFGPNYAYRQQAITALREYNMLEHHHLKGNDKEEVRRKTLQTVLKFRQAYKLSLQQTKQNPNKLSLFSNGYIFYDLGSCVRSGVHAFLYSKALYSLGTQKHQSLVQRAGNYKDIGCFALTELTHGSNVRGILTEAHYNHQNKQFIINTPSKEGMKFWIGGAAQTANSAVVWAQMYIGQKCYGVHAFVVPIRDIQTHKLMPGVLIGDCGIKNGLNGIDNGFILFDKVRIPKQNQLDRISGIDQNGKFRSIVKNDEKRFGLQLAALSGGRFMISIQCVTISVSALTIAIRYVNERRQFKKNQTDKKQSLLIDYPLTKRRLMPLLATSLVQYTSSMKDVFQWDYNSVNILDPEHPVIQTLHAISSVMKAKTSWFASSCIKQCRQMLGGHGYSLYSKLGVLFNDNDVNLTWQGDNHVLIQQTTKYVLEEAQNILQKGKQTINQNLKFLSNPPSEQITINRQNLLCLKKALQFMQFKLFTKIQQTGLNMLELKQKKLPIMQIWNNSQLFLGKDVALIYSDICNLNIMIKTISLSKSISNTNLLTLCTRLWILSMNRKDDFVDAIHYPLIERLISELSHQLAPLSLQLLEVISTDHDIIGSPFSRSDSKGIQTYLQMILKQPINQVPEWWQEIAKTK